MDRWTTGKPDPHCLLLLTEAQEFLCQKTFKKQKPTQHRTLNQTHVCSTSNAQLRQYMQATRLPTDNVTLPQVEVRLSLFPRLKFSARCSTVLDILRNRYSHSQIFTLLLLWTFKRMLIVATFCQVLYVANMKYHMLTMCLDRSKPVDSYATFAASACVSNLAFCIDSTDGATKPVTYAVAVGVT